MNDENYLVPQGSLEARYWELQRRDAEAAERARLVKKANERLLKRVRELLAEVPAMAKEELPRAVTNARANRVWHW
jgi:hypothetical protein